MQNRQRMVVAPGWQPVLARQGLNGPGAAWACAAGDLIKDRNQIEIRRLVVDGDAGPVTLFLKKYRVAFSPQNLSALWRGVLWGGAKVQHEYENLAQLRAWGLDAPEPVAWGEERRAGLLRWCFLLSRGIPEPVPLDAFIRDHLPSLPGDQQRATRRELLDKLADYLRRLHDRRFVHFDLYWRNIILTGYRLDHFALLDAHKGRVWRASREAASRAQDLAALDAAAPWYFRRTERLRFYCRYRGVRRLGPADKSLVRLALGLAAPIRHRQLRRVREAHR